ncbi:MAG: ATP-binding protein [Oscillospiraceae bacterium]|nr:ATP-binding protein [Oscillospiraceae bacterium]
MMTEISLNILDVAQNSVRAGAENINISVTADISADKLTVTVEDDGCGMSSEQLAGVTDPFYTTRTTRKVGLGVSFFKQAAEDTGGSFDIISEQGAGTTVTAVFVISSIDRMPLGDMTSTIHSLITLNQQINFVYTYCVDSRKFVLDTKELSKILGDIPFDAPEVSDFIRDYLEENKTEIDCGVLL